MSTKHSKLSNIHRVNEGIRSGKISDADFLSFALNNSKNKTPVKTLPTNSQPASTDKENHLNNSRSSSVRSSDSNKRFRSDICSPHAKEVHVPHISSPPIDAILATFHSSTITSHTSATDNPKTSPVVDKEATTTSVSSPHVYIDSHMDVDVDGDVDTGNADNSESNATIGRDFEGIDGVKQRLENHLVHILNNASYEELLQLPQVGPSRATRLLTQRNAGEQFRCVDDVEKMFTGQRGGGAWVQRMWMDFVLQKMA
eukprot:gene22518-27486_t